MSDSICNFMPAKNEDSSIKTVRFVYETECLTLRQPFVCPIYMMHIVTAGHAVLRMGDMTYPLSRGDIFFVFPAQLYYLDADKEFAYIYISFMGSGAATVLSRCSVTPTAPVYRGHEHLCPIFEDAVRRVNQKNANLLTEGVLYYALSFVNGDGSDGEDESSAEDIFEAIVDYVDRHYREPDFSLTDLASVFSYTKKYLSFLFKKHMQIGFSNYLNNLRIQYANELIEKGNESITEIAFACGYRDYSYFARVFKKRTGKTPTESMRFLRKSSPDNDE